MAQKTRTPLGASVILQIRTLEQALEALHLPALSCQERLALIAGMQSLSDPEACFRVLLGHSRWIVLDDLFEGSVWRNLANSMAMRILEASQPKVIWVLEALPFLSKPDTNQLRIKGVEYLCREPGRALRALWERFWTPEEIERLMYVVLEKGSPAQVSRLLEANSWRKLLEIKILSPQERLRAVKRIVRMGSNMSYARAVRILKNDHHYFPLDTPVTAEERCVALNRIAAGRKRNGMQAMRALLGDLRPHVAFSEDERKALVPAAVSCAVSELSSGEHPALRWVSAEDVRKLLTCTVDLLTNRQRRRLESLIADEKSKEKINRNAHAA